MKFELKSTNNVVLSNVTIANGQRVELTNASNTLRIKTDEKGLIYLKSLPMGNYELREISAPKRVNIDVNTQKFDIKENDSEGKFYQIENEIKKVDIKVQKEWKDSEGTHPEVKFKLLRKVEGSEFKEVDTKEEPSYAQLTLLSGQKEITWNGLNAYDKETDKPYVYKVVEIGDNETQSSGDGIVTINGIKYKSTVAPQENVIKKLMESFKYTAKETLTFKVTNEKVDSIKGKFTISKITFDKDNTENIPLTGAVFTLSKNNDSKLPEKFDRAEKEVLNSDGSLKFNNLKPGVYDLRETKPPMGYKLSDKEFVVVVRENGDTRVIDKNEYFPDKFPIEIIKGEEPNIPERKIRSEAKNIDREITVSNYNLHQENDGSKIYPNLGQHLIMEFDLLLPQDAIKEDTFTLKIDSKLNINGIRLDEVNIGNIYTKYGELVATAKKTDSKGNEYIYELSEYANNHSDIRLNINIPLFIDSNEIWYDMRNAEFSNQVANMLYKTGPFDVIYEPSTVNITKDFSSDRYSMKKEDGSSQHFSDYLSSYLYINEEEKK